MNDGLSRRELFALFRPGRKRRADRVAIPEAREPDRSSSAATTRERVAIIQGRYCLAYSEPCTVCVDACPVPGALPLQDGVPLVDLDVCTGCGVCHEVCPARPNAVLLLPKRPKKAP